MEVEWLQLQTSIISEVKKYPCLYNSNHISRWNARRRGPYWEAVAAAVAVRDVTDADCRRIWKSLRDKYVREIRLGSTRDADGTLLAARSKWPLLHRLDFLREHIRSTKKKRFYKNINFTRSSGAASQEEEPDSIDCNESASTDLACQDAAVEDVSAEGRLDSPVDFEIEVSPGASDNVDHSMDEAEAATPSSSARDVPSMLPTRMRPRRNASLSKPPGSVPGPRINSVRRRGAYGLRGKSTRGRRRGRPTTSRDRKVPPLASEWTQRRRRGRPPSTLRRWAPPVQVSSSSGEEDAQDDDGVGKIDEDGKAEEEGEHCNSEDTKQERREAALEVALCRFVTAVVSKVALPSGGPARHPPSLKTEMQVDASDGDTLFLLGLRGLMSKLDAETKSRTQIDILRILHERVADAEARIPEPCDDNEGEGREDDATTAVNLERSSPITVE